MVGLALVRLDTAVICDGDVTVMQSQLIRELFDNVTQSTCDTGADFFGRDCHCCTVRVH